VYKHAIDDAMAGRPFDIGLMDELEGMANRGFTEGFYRRHPPAEYQNYERGMSRSERQQFVGAIIDQDDEWLTIDVKNRFERGDQLQLMTPGGNTSFTLPTILDRNGHETDAAPGSGHIVRIPLSEGMQKLSVDDYALLILCLPDRA